MTDVAGISSAPPERTSMDHAALREGGMELIRLWARETWTDHNLHDPGITMLEAGCYAMTELGMRLQLDMADLVSSGEANAAADLPPAHRVLPVGPVNRQDLRRVLLDHPLVSDAQIFLPADNEVAFYESPGNPPLAYAPGAPPRPRVRTAGLYEVLVELAERDLNSNTYAIQVTVDGQVYDIDLALPFWDEPEAAGFRDGVTIDAVTMVLEAGQAWRPLPEAQSYFGMAEVTYTGPAGQVIVPTWIVLQITTVLSQPGVDSAAILAAARATVESTSPGQPVPAFASRVRRAAAAVDQLGRHVAAWRNLGEQCVRIGVARVQEIAVHARIEVTGGIDVEQLLAGVLADIDAMLSPRVRFLSLAERLGREVGADADAPYDGPLLRNGFLAPGVPGAGPMEVLFVSDVLRLIMHGRDFARPEHATQQNPVGRDIVAVTDLALANYINNRPITVDAQDCLHLVEVYRYRPRLSVAKSRLVALRNDEEVRYDGARLETLFDALLAQAEAGAGTADDPSAVWPVPRGDVLPVGTYTPLQEDLPSNYAVGHAVLPDSASTQRQAAARQLRGYLLLFEQFLGDATAQLANINRFFSGDAAEGTSRFTRPPFDIPGAPQLLKRFPAGGDWTAFVADPHNPVALALQEAAESRGQFLERRNRMLDHLLARQGEEAVALGQEVHRWAQAELVPSGAPQLQLAQIQARREAANARLVRTKAALLREVPELHALRLLAHGHPFHGDSGLLRIEGVAPAFRWSLAPAGQERLRAVAAFATAAKATSAAESALDLAGRAVFYTVDDIGGGQRRLRLKDGTTAAAEVVAESVQTWSNAADANTALAEMAASFAALRIAASLAPMERLVAYLAGMRSPQRRHLVVPLTLHFEIYDDPPAGPLFGKRWRLWEQPGNTGQVLLESLARFEAATDDDAKKAAQESVRNVLRHGLDEWNYRVVPAAAATFTCELLDAAGVTLAVRPGALPSQPAVQAALEATIEHLYRHHGGEGFFLVEHLLLRPRSKTDSFLSLPDEEGDEEEDADKRVRDPYSHQLSVIFPSGYARDFSQPRADAALVPVTPDRFRDPEFRRHAERMVRQACPAHLWPTIYWVDRQDGSTVSPATLDALDQRYFAWLDSVLVPGAAPAAVVAAREALVQTLNAIADDAP